MIGIYKITNLVNGHCYIGQSRNIVKRWSEHKCSAIKADSPSYNYPLQRAIRKHGIDAFKFEILEECSISELNDKESFWIKTLSPKYNQTTGGDYQIVPQKLTLDKVLEIQSILIADIEGNISHKILAQQYGVHKDTIRDINVGRTWRNDKYIYPLHYSKYDASNPQKAQYYCKDCGIEISKGSEYCIKCSAKKNRTVSRPTRNELKHLIRSSNFSAIGRQFGVSDNAIRKWCKAENLPTSAREIKKIPDNIWENI